MIVLMNTAELGYLIHSKLLTLQESLFKVRLNSDLTEAIALGHDVGHTPYGHAGEKLLNEFLEGSIPYPMEALRRDTN